MRPRNRFELFLPVLLSFWMVCLISACGKGDHGADRPAADIAGTTTTTSTGDSTGLPPIEPASCGGVCVPVAPATYTGPSLFWIGPAWSVPSCPAETHYQGIQGTVASSVMLPIRARECRITPEPTCGIQGLTCAPYPPPDFHICIHHDDERPCLQDDQTPEYPERLTLIQDATTATITLCCMKPLGAG